MMYNASPHGTCHQCGHPMIWHASQPAPWCAVYGTHRDRPIALPPAPPRRATVRV